MYLSLMHRILGTNTRLVVYVLHIHICEVPGLALVNSPPLTFSTATSTQPGGNLPQGIKTFQSKTNLLKEADDKIVKQSYPSKGYFVLDILLAEQKET